MIVYSLDNGGDALVEVVEISDELDKAEVDEGILAADYTAVYLFFS